MKKVKTLLIVPPVTIFGSDPTVPSPSPPLGLAYIAAYLESHGYEVEILDCLVLGQDEVRDENHKRRYGISEDKIRGYIAKYSPDIVGITSMYTAYARDVHNVAALVKRYNSHIYVVCGGSHASIAPELMLKDKNMDIIVSGEGEVTFLELVERIAMNEELSRISGIAIRVGEKIVKNEHQPFISDLDSLPFPAWHLLPMDLYIHSKSNYIMRAPHMTMVTSRGCPGNCVFCSIHSVWGHRWRGRSAKNIVDEMELLITKYDVREFHFLDDSMGSSQKRLGEICDEIVKRRLDIKWTVPNGIAYWKLNEWLLKRMKKSGCYRITFGIESGNIDTLKFIGKSHNSNQAKQIIQYSNRIGLWTVCTFIIGFPYEQEDSIMDTINFSIESDIDMAVFYLLGAFPGTRVYDIFRKENLLDFDWSLENLSVTFENYEDLGKSLASDGVTKTKYFSRLELNNYRRLAYRTFLGHRFRSFLNPLRIIRKIKSIEDSKYALRVALAILKSILLMMTRKKFAHQLLHSGVFKSKINRRKEDNNERKIARLPNMP